MKDCTDEDFVYDGAQITDDYFIKQYNEIKAMQEKEHECGPECFNWDLERMQEAIDGPSYAPPDDLDREGLRNWLLEVANNTDEENEKYLVKRDI